MMQTMGVESNGFSRKIHEGTCLPPYCERPSAIHSALPSETFNIGTCSTSSRSGITQFKSQKPLENTVHCTLNLPSIATRAFSLEPGINKVEPIPNGLSVRLLIFRMDSLVSAAFRGPVASTPTPPAFETAATRSGFEIQLIPGKIIGYLHLKRFVTRVEIAGAVMVNCVDANMNAFQTAFDRFCCFCFSSVDGSLLSPDANISFF